MARLKMKKVVVKKLWKPTHRIEIGGKTYLVMFCSEDCMTSDGPAFQKAEWDNHLPAEFYINDNRWHHYGEIIDAEFVKPLNREVEIRNWMTMPPIRMARMADIALEDGRRTDLADYSRALDSDAQRAAFTAEYLNRRAEGASHAVAVKAANRRLVKVRKALGYTHPESGGFGL